MADLLHQTERWLSAAKAGDSDALGRALDSCRNYLLMIADQELNPQLRAKAGASDIVQQTFLEAQQAFVRFDGASQAELLAWLRRMLLNNVANCRRHWSETDKRQIDLEVPLASSPSRTGNSWLPDGSLTPSREMMVDERDARLNAIINSLPDDYRQVLTLRYRENRAFEEIAVTMNRTSNAVRKLWARAIERLQEELDQDAGRHV